VLRRDHYRCQRCGHHDPSGKTLEAHHLRPGYDIDAGITLGNSDGCGCHRAVDRHAR
jgi:5-methylcytosine-specific restriction endonuclease McrA